MDISIYFIFVAYFLVSTKSVDFNNEYDPGICIFDPITSNLTTEFGIIQEKMDACVNMIKLENVGLEYFTNTEPKNRLKKYNTAFEQTLTKNLRLLHGNISSELDGVKNVSKSGTVTLQNILKEIERRLESKISKESKSLQNQFSEELKAKSLEIEQKFNLSLENIKEQFNNLEQKINQLYKINEDENLIMDIVIGDSDKALKKFISLDDNKRLYWLVYKAFKNSNFMTIFNLYKLVKDYNKKILLLNALRNAVLITDNVPEYLFNIDSEINHGNNPNPIGSYFPRQAPIASAGPGYAHASLSRMSSASAYGFNG